MNSKNKSLIPYSRQCLDSADFRAVKKVLSSDFLTQGPVVREFESALAEYCGVRYAVAVSTGTAALHLACLALGVSKGKEVLTTPISFLATANAVLYCGGRPVFSDVEAGGFNLDLDSLLTKVNRRTVGVIPVHMGGNPLDVVRLRSIADKKKIFVLEDACHALGAQYKVGKRWHKVGDCAYSDASVFSFHPVKSIATGEGGAITTNRKDIYEKLLLLRTHGVTKLSEKFESQKLAYSEWGGERYVNPWYYEMQTLGFNYRLTDIQSALGLSQLKKIESFMKRRREIAAFYDRTFSQSTLVSPVKPRANTLSAYHLYVLQLNLESLSKDRAFIFRKLQALGLGVQIHYIPIHLQPYYRKHLRCKSGDYPNAEKYYQRALSIPIYPGLKDSQMRRVVRLVLEAVAASV